MRLVRHRAATAIALALAAAATACAPADEPTTSYTDVAGLASALDAADIACALEYEGLADGDREVSTCTIDGEFVLLQVWDDPALLDEFLAVADPPAGARAHGDGWMIEVETEATAQRVATALGGDVGGS